MIAIVLHVPDPEGNRDLAGRLSELLMCFGGRYGYKCPWDGKALPLPGQLLVTSVAPPYPNTHYPVISRDAALALLNNPHATTFSSGARQAWERSKGSAPPVAHPIGLAPELERAIREALFVGMAAHMALAYEEAVKCAVTLRGQLFNLPRVEKTLTDDPWEPMLRDWALDRGAAEEWKSAYELLHEAIGIGPESVALSHLEHMKRLLGALCVTGKKMRLTKGGETVEQMMYQVSEI